MAESYFNAEQQAYLREQREARRTPDAELIERYLEALEEIAAGAGANAGRCLDCDSIARIAADALQGAMS